MKIALIHGAILNAGDFLIKERAKQCLQNCIEDVDITEYYRNYGLDKSIDEINQNDIAILAGGPGYTDIFLKILISQRINDVRIPIAIMGMGQYFGYSGLNATSLYQYSFEEECADFLKRCMKDTGALGCRGYISANVLRNNGCEDVIMTGCPAWYDYEYLNQTHYNGKALNGVQKICISDCANKEYTWQVIELAKYIRSFFGNKEIVYVLHKGSDNLPLTELPEFTKLGIRIVDISGRGTEGFSVYDDCDLHIGYRVHSHIYNLAKRKLSILIEEDLRGGELNQALGLPQITQTVQTASDNNLVQIPNQALLYQIDDYLMNMAGNGYVQMDAAYMSMNRIYRNMERHIAMMKGAV